MSEKVEPRNSAEPVFPVEDKALAEHMAYAENPYQEDIIALRGVIKALDEDTATISQQKFLEGLLAEKKSESDIAALEARENYSSENIPDKKNDTGEAGETTEADTPEGKVEVETSDPEVVEEDDEPESTPEDEDVETDEPEVEESPEEEEFESERGGVEALTPEDIEKLKAAGFSREDIEDYELYQQFLALIVENPNRIANMMDIPARAWTHYGGRYSSRTFRLIMNREKSSGRNAQFINREGGLYKDFRVREVKDREYALRAELTGLRKYDIYVRQQLRRIASHPDQYSEEDIRFYAAAAVRNIRRSKMYRAGIREGIGKQASKSEKCAELVARAQAGFAQIENCLVNKEFVNSASAKGQSKPESTTPGFLDASGQLNEAEVNRMLDAETLQLLSELSSYSYAEILIRKSPVKVRGILRTASRVTRTPDRRNVLGRLQVLASTQMEKKQLEQLVVDTAMFARILR